MLESVNDIAGTGPQNQDEARKSLIESLANMLNSLSNMGSRDRDTLIEAIVLICFKVCQSHYQMPWEIVEDAHHNLVLVLKHLGTLSNTHDQHSAASQIVLEIFG